MAEEMRLGQGIGISPADSFRNKSRYEELLRVALELGILSQRRYDKIILVADESRQQEADLLLRKPEMRKYFADQEKKRKEIKATNHQARAVERQLTRERRKRRREMGDTLPSAIVKIKGEDD